MQLPLPELPPGEETPIEKLKNALSSKEKFQHHYLVNKIYTYYESFTKIIIIKKLINCNFNNCYCNFDFLYSGALRAGHGDV